MSSFFVDSSALIKRYVLESGTAWVRRLSSPTAANIILVAADERLLAAAAAAGLDTENPNLHA